MLGDLIRLSSGNVNQKKIVCSLKALHDLTTDHTISDGEGKTIIIAWPCSTVCLENDRMKPCVFSNT